VSPTVIEVVRVWGADGIAVEYAWKPDACYLLRDDHPYLDFRTRGYPAQARDGAKISKLSDVCEDGVQWQRWDLEQALSKDRRLGEISATLKVPRDCLLRCYVVPAALVSYRDVMVMAEEIEGELGFAAVWDMVTDQTGRSWSRPSGGPRASMPSEMMGLVEEEMRAAGAIRREPFTELGPPSRRDEPLGENALISHWAARRSGQICDLVEALSGSLAFMTESSARNNPDGRQTRIDKEVDRLRSALNDLNGLKVRLATFIEEIELGTPIYHSPLMQRDHRLRILLRAFAPAASEAISETESALSHYPPLFLNRLWELWGIVWIARQLRDLGFSGPCTVEAVDSVKRCSWHLSLGETVLELDFEAEPTLIDYGRLPPVHERDVPALEWAARHQALDVERPFLGTELKCSPDYMIRITTPTGKRLLVGDACLASALHHGKGELTGTKPYTVEKYRRTIGWADEGSIVRCHALGGFVIYPPPAGDWTDFEKMPGASDCMLLCPSPGGDPEASRRLERLLGAVAPDFATLIGQTYGEQ
jgi:hypothetical protein